MRPVIGFFLVLLAACADSTAPKPSAASPCDSYIALAERFFSFAPTRTRVEFAGDPAQHLEVLLWSSERLQATYNWRDGSDRCTVSSTTLTP